MRLNSVYVMKIRHSQNSLKIFLKFPIKYRCISRSLTWPVLPSALLFFFFLPRISNEVLSIFFLVTKGRITELEELLFILVCENDFQ